MGPNTRQGDERHGMSSQASADPGETDATLQKGVFCKKGEKHILMGWNKKNLQGLIGPKIEPSFFAGTGGVRGRASPATSASEKRAGAGLDQPAAAASEGLGCKMTFKELA